MVEQAGAGKGLLGAFLWVYAFRLVCSGFNILLRAPACGADKLRGRWGGRR